MSITDDLAALVATGTLNAEGFTAVLELLADIQERAAYHLFWVDPVDGENDASGLTPETALQTISEAIARAAPGSFVEAKLLDDYTMTENLITGGRWVKISGRSAADAGAQRQFTQTVSGGEARRLVCQDGGGWFLSRLDLMLTKSAISSGPTSFVSGHLKTLRLLDCGVDVETGVTTVSVMGADGIAILEVDTITALDDAIAGKWVGGVSSGTNPNTLGKVLTNLATL